MYVCLLPWHSAGGRWRAWKEGLREEAEPSRLVSALWQWESRMTTIWHWGCPAVWHHSWACCFCISHSSSCSCCLCLSKCFFRTRHAFLGCRVGSRDVLCCFRHFCILFEPSHVWDRKSAFLRVLVEDQASGTLPPPFALCHGLIVLPTCSVS